MWLEMKLTLALSRNCHHGRGGIRLKKKMLLITICYSTSKLLRVLLGYWCNIGEFSGAHFKCHWIIEE
jgi:hypothetical protein